MDNLERTEGVEACIQDGILVVDQGFKASTVEMVTVVTALV
jgi:hypothetical protein